ncbi:MAG: hypothetical protein ACI9VR_000802 [Cognaticolwellia sp.]|jgi:hypothetical protein
MEFTCQAEHLKPLLRRALLGSGAAVAVGALMQAPLLFVGMGPVLWSNLIGLFAMGVGGLVLGQALRRSHAGPRLDVVLEGGRLTTQWPNEDKQVVSLGPDTQVSTRGGWLMVKSGQIALGIPVASPSVKEFREALDRARFGDRPRVLRRKDPHYDSLPPANDAVTPDGRLDNAARAFAFGSLVTLGLTVAGGLLVGFDVGLPLFGLFLASAGGFLFIEKGLVPLKTKRLTQVHRYSGTTETTGVMAQVSGALNLIGSALLALLGVLLFVIGFGAQLS